MTEFEEVINECRELSELILINNDERMREETPFTEVFVKNKYYLIHN